jgi:alpha-tubulin suppressor-like RCC1 family protein
VPTTGVRTVQSIEAGSAHTCGITTTGLTRCWGATGSGRATPPPDVVGNTATDTSAGAQHSCAILSHAWGTEVSCWGLDNHGQVSHVPSIPTSPLGNPIPLENYEQVTTGQLHTCALSDFGRIRCWGNDAYGQTSGIGAHPSYPTSSWAEEDEPGVWLFPYFDWSDVSAGDWHTCAINDQLGANNATCWGFGGAGRTTPPPGTFETVSAGGAHTCGILTGGTVACWGSNQYGQATPPALPGRCSLLQSAP